MEVSLHATTYKSVDVNGLSIFYREAGSPDAPTLLLLHGPARWCHRALK